MSDRYLTRPIPVLAKFCDGTLAELVKLAVWLTEHGVPSRWDGQRPVHEDPDIWSPRLMIDNDAYFEVEKPLYWVIQPVLNGYKVETYIEVTPYDEDEFTRTFVEASAGGVR